MFTAADGEMHESVVPVRAFPIGEPERGIALVSTEGHELAWIDGFEQLPDAIAQLIREELESREFVRKSGASAAFRASPARAPGMSRPIVAMPAGAQGEEDIRRLDREKLLIADTHGIQYLVRNLAAMDRISRKILDRFL